MLELHCALLAGPRRFGELAHEMGVNQVTLTQRLGDLERRGLVQRIGESPGARYAFTPSGEGFHRVGEALARWAATAARPQGTDRPEVSPRG